MNLKSTEIELDEKEKMSVQTIKRRDTLKKKKKFGYSMYLVLALFRGSVKETRQEKEKRKGRIKEDLVYRRLPLEWYVSLADLRRPLDCVHPIIYNHEYCTEFCSIQRTK